MCNYYASRQRGLSIFEMQCPQQDSTMERQQVGKSTGDEWKIPVFVLATCDSKILILLSDADSWACHNV